MSVNLSVVPLATRREEWRQTGKGDAKSRCYSEFGAAASPFEVDASQLPAVGAADGES